MLSYDGRMAKVVLDDTYYAEQAHDQAPWLIRNDEYRVVGHYTVSGGVSWGGAMKEADKSWLADLIQQKITG